MNKKVHTSNKVLIAAVIAVIGYAAAAIAFQIFTEIELSSTLTTCWYGFWGVELASLAAIKTTKVKHNADGSEVGEEEAEIEEYEENEEYQDE